MLVFIAAGQLDEKHKLSAAEKALMVALVLLAVFLMVAGLYSNCVEISKSWQQIGTPFSCATISKGAKCS